MLTDFFVVIVDRCSFSGDGGQCSRGKYS